MFFTLCSGLDQSHLVSEPLDRRTGYEYTAFKGILDLAANTCRDCCQQTVPGFYGTVAGIHQKEAACTIGVFNFSRFKAALAEKSRLLVSCCSGDRDCTAEDIFSRITVNAAGRLYLREHGRRDMQLVEDLLIPAQLVDIKQHRAGSVGIIGHMYRAAGQLPDQPGIDCTE